MKFKQNIILMLLLLEMMLSRTNCRAAPIDLFAPIEISEKKNLLGFIKKHFLSSKEEETLEPIEPVKPQKNATVIVWDKKKFMLDDEKKIKLLQAMRRDNANNIKGHEFEMMVNYVMNMINKLKKNDADEKLINVLIDYLKPAKNSLFPFLSQSNLEDGLREKQKEIIQYLKQEKQKALQSLQAQNMTETNTTIPAIPAIPGLSEKPTFDNLNSNDASKLISFGPKTPIPTPQLKPPLPSTPYHSDYYYPEQLMVPNNMVPQYYEVPDYLYNNDNYMSEYDRRGCSPYPDIYMHSEN